MIRIGGVPHGVAGEDTEFCGLVYPDGDEISGHLARRIQSEPFYQSDKLEQALQFVKRRRMAIDCGAWVGAWSRALAVKFQRVTAIEANPDSARCLFKNCPNVIIRNVALGNEFGDAVVGKEVNGSSVGSRVLPGGKGAQVNLRRLDDLVGEPPDQYPIDYIKVHVNGMELQALRGAEQTIRRHRPVLTVVLKAAIEDFGDTAEGACAFLRGLGYRHAGGEKPYGIWIPK